MTVINSDMCEAGGSHAFDGAIHRCTKCGKFPSPQDEQRAKNHPDLGHPTPPKEVVEVVAEEEPKKKTKKTPESDAPSE